MIINSRDLIALKSSVLSNLFAFELLLLFLFVFLDRGTVVQFSELTVAFPSIWLHILAVSLNCGPGTLVVSLRIAGLTFLVKFEFPFEFLFEFVCIGRTDCLFVSGILLVCSSPLSNFRSIISNVALGLIDFFASGELT